MQTTNVKMQIDVRWQNAIAMISCGDSVQLAIRTLVMCSKVKKNNAANTKKNEHIRSAFAFAIVGSLGLDSIAGSWQDP